MFRGRNQEERTRRKAELGVEALDDRVVLSAVAMHAAAAEKAARAVADRPALVARFEADVNRLQRQFERQLAHFNGLVSTQISRVNALSEGTLSQTLDRINTGEALNVPRDEAGLSRASSLVASHLNQTITQFNLRFNRFAHNLDNRLFRLGQRYVKPDPALVAAVNAVRGNFQSAEAAFNTMLNNDLMSFDSQDR
jgi:hypothetical protein